MAPKRNTNKKSTKKSTQKSKSTSTSSRPRILVPSDESTVKTGNYSLSRGINPHTARHQEYLRHATQMFELIRNQTDADLVIDINSAAHFLGSTSAAVEAMLVRFRHLYPGIHVRGSQKQGNGTFRIEKHQDLAAKGLKKGGDRKAVKEEKKEKYQEFDTETEEEEEVEGKEPADDEPGVRKGGRMDEESDEDDGGNAASGFTAPNSTISVAA